MKWIVLCVIAYFNICAYGESDRESAKRIFESKLTLCQKELGNLRSKFNKYTNDLETLDRVVSDCIKGVPTKSTNYTTCANGKATIGRVTKISPDGQKIRSICSMLNDPSFAKMCKTYLGIDAENFRRQFESEYNETKERQKKHLGSKKKIEDEREREKSKLYDNIDLANVNERINALKNKRERIVKRHNIGMCDHFMPPGGQRQCSCHNAIESIDGRINDLECTRTLIENALATSKIDRKYNDMSNDLQSEIDFEQDLRTVIVKYDIQRDLFIKINDRIENIKEKKDELELEVQHLHNLLEHDLLNLSDELVDKINNDEMEKNLRIAGYGNALDEVNRNKEIDASIEREELNHRRFLEYIKACNTKNETINVNSKSNRATRRSRRRKSN